MKKIMIILTIFIFTGCNKIEKLVPNKANINEFVIEDKVLDGYIIKNVSLIYDSGISTFKATIKNNQNDILSKKIHIIFKAKSNETIAELEGYINDLKKSKSTELVITSDIDLTDAYSVLYSIK